MWTGDSEFENVDIDSPVRRAAKPDIPEQKLCLTAEAYRDSPKRAAGDTPPSDKKILIVSDAWHPQVNGVVVALSAIKQILETKGYAVSVLHPGLFFTVPLPIYPEIRLSLFSGRLMKKILKTDRPDYIHIATEGPLGFTARILCKRYGIPFTTSFHTHFQLYAFVRFSKFFRPAHAYLRWFHGASRRTMAATPGLMAALEASAFDNLVLWPLGVDSDRFVRVRPPEGVSLPKPVFTYFGRLALEKSPEEFLRLPLPGSKLVIGDGPARAELEEKYGRSAVFVGYKRGLELVTWLSLSDVVVLPSRTETFGLVVLEALACGVPVAAYDVMGPRDIITHGVDGFLDEDLATAAVKCLNLSPDACRATALKYSWGASAQAFLCNLVPTQTVPNQTSVASYAAKRLAKWIAVILSVIAASMALRGYLA
jgi:glycosyltransferase involved in cell wall biosynthesis